MTRSPTARSAKLTLVASIGALTIASITYRILITGKLEHTSLVFIGIPALLALSLTGLRPRSTVGTINKTIAVALCLSGILFGEGFICILMASPLFFLIGTIAGKLSSRNTIPIPDDANGKRGASWKRYGLILLGPLSLEGVLPNFELGREETVTVSRTIAASPSSVRAALAAPMSFDSQLPIFFRLGFPTPGRTSGSGLDIGDHRSIEFIHGDHHPGTLTLEVTRSEPGLVVYTAVSDDSYITHWLAWRSSEVRWEEVAPGQTRVTWTLHYVRRLDPAFYFKPLERYGVSLAGRYLIQTLATPRGEVLPSRQAANAQPIRPLDVRHARAAH